MPTLFERINRLGVKFSTLELLSAWSWSEDFGFGDIVEEPDLILRCASAILKGSSRD
jgi:hypothetical protein